jgi:hypothetical protein
MAGTGAFEFGRSMKGETLAAKYGCNGAMIVDPAVKSAGMA